MEIYQKKTQHQHILDRPDTYIGSIKLTTSEEWVIKNDKIILKEIVYNPGLYKIFDEILVNAADNKQICKSMKTIKVNISNTKISVFNDGKGIPVRKHAQEDMYIPTMIFGNLLTSSNYDDEKTKVTGGRNGFGAKLCNIYSSEFIIETVSNEHKKKFKQVWKDNMYTCEDPMINDVIDEKDYTLVSFIPDFKKFGIDKLTKDMIALLSKRVYDVAATTTINNDYLEVYLNDKKINIFDFKRYTDLYFDKKVDVASFSCKNWDIGLTLSNNNFKQISFVNSIFTKEGGCHVNYIADIIIKKLIEIVTNNLSKNKIKITKITPSQIKNHLFIFVNCLINNPTFNSQLKETLTTQSKDFGSECRISDNFIKNIPNNIIDTITNNIINSIKNKEESIIKKEINKINNNKKSLHKIDKLQDAIYAGSKHSINCVLILTEGDSAKTMVVSGLSKEDKNYYGVFPLKGKLLNVRDINFKKILDNEEFNNIINIIGLQYKKDYSTQKSLKELRYGKIIIMTDQDQDGLHIKGLFINFIHFNWPSLIKTNFIQEFITPLIKIKYDKKENEFFSEKDFKKWLTDRGNVKNLTVKYYKGLGTSTSNEAKLYFKNKAKYIFNFIHDEESDKNIELAFKKTNADQRKTWILNYSDNLINESDNVLLSKDKTVSYFINNELVSFSYYDTNRSIPCLIDGLKPCQRKVIYTCFKRNDKKDIKVAQLAGSVAEITAYHHGEVSLMSTIINLAQNYVGSNNINLLEPNGQFGSRLTGGKDSASPRYIFTKLNEITKLIFNKNDNLSLKYNYDDDKMIEPKFYVPIIPMCLVNGTMGIGTGWKSEIPKYNPIDIINNIYSCMENKKMKKMKPYYNNFKGKIKKTEKGYDTIGVIERTKEDDYYDINDKLIACLTISELPIGIWSDDYKSNVLNKLKDNDTIINCIPSNTDLEVCFKIFMYNDKLEEFIENGEILKTFKLKSSLSLNSMNTFDENGRIVNYKTPEDILNHFYKIRLEYYEKRKQNIINTLETEVMKLCNQARFIVEKCDNTIQIENKNKKDIEKILTENKYDLLNNDFNYILNMPIWSLSKENKDNLIDKKDIKCQELKILKEKTAIELWREDLEELSKMINL